MDQRKRTDKIRKILRITYPDVKTQLHHENPFQLLIATILSAQCTDKQVNAVTGNLFGRYPSPETLGSAPLGSIEKLIHATGFYHNKSRNIKNCSRELVRRFAGNVPESLEELVTLPGVGRKTANVVLGAAFGIPGMVVDTHVARISRRLDLTDSKDPKKIEFDLMKIMPKGAWNVFSLHLIYLGRSFCKARKPDCARCPLERLCNFPDKTNHKDTIRGNEMR